MSWKKRAGRVIFSSISHRVTSPGAIASVRRGESATYVEPERTSGRRRTYFQTWPLLCLETTPVLPFPFATNQVSSRAIRKTYRTKPPLSVFRLSRWVIFGHHALSQISPSNDALLSEQAHSPIIILIVTYPPFSPLSAHFNSLESRHSVWNGIENMYNNTGYPMWVLYII